MKCAATMVSGATFKRSPCAGCKDRQANYACIDKCLLPGQYTASMGDMNHGMPDHLCHFGRHMTFTPPDLPVTRNICSIELPSSIGGKGSRRKGRKGPKNEICIWMDCDKPVRSGFCSKCNMRIHKRQHSSGWPLRFVMAPLKNKLGYLLVDEARGQLDDQPWYVETKRLIENGVLAASTWATSKGEFVLASRMTPSKALKEEIERAIRKYAEHTGAFITGIKIVTGQDRPDGIKTIESIEIATNT